jgi:rhamnosyltransferase
LSEASPKVSVFLPTYNGGPLLARVLDAVLGQEVDFEFEVLCIDSGSTDETLSILRERSIPVTSIPNHEFNHGLTRDKGASMARGEIVIFLVQDAVPHGKSWMQTLVSNFQDKRVAGAYCHQIPHANCNPFLRDRLEGWVSGEGNPTTKHIPDPMDFELLTPLEKWRMIAFDDVASAVRRSVLDELPFEERSFGEDIAWARSAILAGHRVVMDPRCAVEHSHNKSTWYEFRRACLDQQNIHRLTGLRLAPNIHHVLRSTAKLSKHLFDVVWNDRALSTFRRVLWVMRIPYFALTQNLAQFLGPLSSHRKNAGAWHWFNRMITGGI